MNDISIEFYRIKHFTMKFKNDLNKLFKRYGLNFEAHFTWRHYHPDIGYNTVEAGFVDSPRKRGCRNFEYFKNLFGKESMHIHPDKICVYPTSEQFLLLYNNLSDVPLSKEEFEEKYTHKKDMFDYLLPEGYDSVNPYNIKRDWQLMVESEYIYPLLKGTKYHGYFDVIKSEHDRNKRFAYVSIIKAGNDIFDYKLLGNCKNCIKKFCKQFQKKLGLKNGTIFYDNDKNPNRCVIVYPYSKEQYRELKQQVKERRLNDV